VINMVEVLTAARVFAIIRTASAEKAVSLCADLLDNGVPLVEITLNTPGALDAIAQVKGLRSAGGRELPVTASSIGAGTVLTARDASEAAEAGADYLVTPGVISEVIVEGGRLGLPVVCGAYTATGFPLTWTRAPSR
jgi:2-dehydro-3-deoxyphosphogluconate aldolase/(4S)-4-hydroxy-2-oxoglutarate aldolase